MSENDAHGARSRFLSTVAVRGDADYAGRQHLLERRRMPPAAVPLLRVCALVLVGRLWMAAL